MGEQDDMVEKQAEEALEIVNALYPENAVEYVDIRVVNNETWGIRADDRGKELIDPKKFQLDLVGCAKNKIVGFCKSDQKLQKAAATNFNVKDTMKKMGDNGFLVNIQK